jgi:hypothetical protein
VRTKRLGLVAVVYLGLVAATGCSSSDDDVGGAVVGGGVGGEVVAVRGRGPGVAVLGTR